MCFFLRRPQADQTAPPALKEKSRHAPRACQEPASSTPRSRAADQDESSQRGRQDNPSSRQAPEPGTTQSRLGAPLPQAHAMPQADQTAPPALDPRPKLAEVTSPIKDQLKTSWENSYGKPWLLRKEKHSKGSLGQTNPQFGACPSRWGPP